MLDDNGIRPPVIAAGINLFGGPLGLIHRHVTGAIPIRRNTKDPAYLVTLKAYVSELLQRHDLLFYIEGGRSYSGEMKAPKTGLLHAAMQSGRTDVVDRADGGRLRPRARGSHPGAPGRQAAAAAVRPRDRGDGPLRGRAISRARSSPSASRSRSTGWTAESRRDVMDLAHLVRDTIGRLHKVLPTAVVAAAHAALDRPAAISSSARRTIIGIAARRRRQPGRARPAARRSSSARRPLADRGIIHVERGGLFRVRERTVLRYYARTLQHLLTGPRRAPRTH